MKVGIFDSGLGGLTVLRALHNMVPKAEYVYLGDTARTPYGSKSQSTILRYSRECAAFLLKQKIDVLVVACNTASSLALEELQASSPCPVIGTIDPAVATCLRVAGTGPVAVIGTSATINTGVYEKRLKDGKPDLAVFSKACPLFVPLVEEGLFSGEILDRVIEHYLEELRAKKPRALILACTHYPLISSALQSYLGSEVKIIDCAQAIAQTVLTLSQNFQTSKAGAGCEYYVTDDVGRFNALATHLLAGSRVEAVKLEGLS